jgi:hypothetical protein
MYNCHTFHTQMRNILRECIMYYELSMGEISVSLSWPLARFLPLLVALPQSTLPPLSVPTLYTVSTILLNKI